jgi:hypothetical protein
MNTMTTLGNTKVDEEDELANYFKTWKKPDKKKKKSASE